MNRPFWILASYTSQILAKTIIFQDPYYCSDTVAGTLLASTLNGPQKNLNKSRFFVNMPPFWRNGRNFLPNVYNSNVDVPLINNVPVTGYSCYFHVLLNSFQLYPESFFLLLKVINFSCIFTIYIYIYIRGERDKYFCYSIAVCYYTYN